MRVTFVQHGFFRIPFGGPRTIYEHANELVRKGHDATVLHPLAAPVRPWAPGIKESFKDLAALVLRASGALTSARLFPLRPSWIALEPSVRSLLVPSLSKRAFPPADILVAASWHVALAVLRAPPRAGRKVYFVHEHEGQRASHKLVDPTYDMPFAFLSQNEPVSDMLRRRGKEILAKIPYGINPRIHRILTPPEKRDPLCVGMMYSPSPLKGASFGFETLRLLRQDFPGLKPIVFGAFPVPPDLPPGTEYFEKPTDEELAILYNRMAVFFSPSWIEGWGAPAHEAMACGCAAVSTDTWGIHEFAVHERNALIIPPRQPGLMASAIRRLLTEHDFRRTLAARGAATARALTWEHSTRIMEDAFQKLLHAGGQAHE